MKKTLTLLFVSILLNIINLGAQNTDHLPGQLLVKLTGKGAEERLQIDLAVVNNHITKLKWEERVSKITNIWLFSFDEKSINEQDMLRLVKQHPNVLEAQFNHTFKERDTAPNDPLYKNQWQWENTGANGGKPDVDIDAAKAWDITTGGLTSTGDTIVVCVVDDGTALNHPDLMANLYKNWGEIPDDGIDNDGNGYIDDFDGWNINSNTDNVGSGSHGVNVAGMIGAVGNNGVGVTGINWHIKIMTVRYGALTEVEVIKAYDYPLIMRKLYNETDGIKGAFVVATNSSWGIDNANPVEYPLWCSYYDTLGVNGILSCGATTNNTVDVDVVGDMPTACPSDYMVSVGRTNDQDQSAGGHGIIHVDLGAPGDNIYTTAANAYTYTTGTSFASPLVAGMIGLLYSAPCSEFMEVAKSKPALSALLIKQYILDGVDKVAGFNTLYKSGGRANVFNALENMLTNCSACQPPGSINIVANTDTTLDLSWEKNFADNLIRIEYKVLGDPNYIIIDSLTVDTFKLTGLTSCTEYEIRLASWCGDTLSNYSKVYKIKTLGCCEVPKNFNVTTVNDTTLLVDWEPLYGAQGYQVLYKSATDPNYTVVQTDADSLLIYPVQKCTDYNIILITNCPKSGAIADSLNIKSSGCDICEAKTYCDSHGEEYQDEWISNFTVNDLSNNSGNDGYYFFNTVTTVLDPGKTYPMSITPAYTNPAYIDYMKVWIDYNQDGDFDDINEFVWDAGESKVKRDTTFTVPLDAKSGNTRLRVIMYYDFLGQDIGPCEVLPFGETEDYCIQITKVPEICDQPVGRDTLEVGATYAKLTWIHPTVGAVNYTLRYRTTVQSPYTYVYNIPAPPVTISGLTPSTFYRWSVRSNCTEDSSAFVQPSATFTTKELVNTKSLDQSNEYKISPNPFNNQLNISWANAKDLPESIEITDQLGKSVKKYSVTNNSAGMQLSDINALPPGMYVLIVRTNSQQLYKKLIKQ